VRDEAEMIRADGASGPDPEVEEISIQTEPMVMNIGPHHPSTHGVFRMRVMFDGEDIADVEPVLGYLHRGSEKLAEERTYTQIVALTDRMDYLSSMTNNQAYILAVEKLAGIEPTPRGVWLRMIAAELQRIASHISMVGFLGNELGTIFTPLVYAFREREAILDMFEMLCGARITLSYVRPSGVFQNAPEDFWPALRRFLDTFPPRMDEIEGLLTENEVVLARLQDVGVVALEDALNASFTGPNLRASGVDWDLRHRNPYEYYDRVEFERPLGSKGDNFDRYLVRVREIRQSLRILEQCIEQIEPGPVRDESLPTVIRPPKGDAYVPAEATKGELGFYLVSDGDVSPYRCHVRAPSFINLTLLRDMLVGMKVADMFVTFGSIDAVMGEVDR